MAVRKVIKRILSRKKVEETPKEIPFIPEVTLKGVSQPSTPGCSVCGEPIAEGQTYVCKSHIRRN